MASSTKSPTYPRYRPPTFGPSGYIPPRFLRTTGDPRGPFVLPASPGYLHLPLRAPPLHRLPGDDTSSGTATASLTTYLGDADLPTQRFSYPLTDRTQTTTGPSGFLDGTATDDFSSPSSPAPRRPSFRRKKLPISCPLWFATTAYHLPGYCFFYCFFSLGGTFFSSTECSIVSGHQTGSSPFPYPIPVPEGTFVTPL